MANRGAALIKKWGRSSAASTAVSIADHLRSLYTPTPPGDCFSTAVLTDGNPYGIAEDLVFSMPCRSNGDGDYEIVEDFVIDDWLADKIKARAQRSTAEGLRRPSSMCCGLVGGRVGGPWLRGGGRGGLGLRPRWAGWVSQVCVEGVPQAADQG